MISSVGTSNLEASGELRVDRDRPIQTVDASDSQPGALASPKSEYGCKVDHDRCIGPDSGSEAM